MADKNQIVLELQAKTTKLEAALKRVQKDFKKTEKQAVKMRISTAGLRRSIGALRNNMLLVSFAFGGTAAAVGGLIKAYGKQELAEKKLQAALRSTGHVAGMSADEFKAMASSLQESTTFGDEAILNAQSLMLTFTKVGREVMPEAIETVLNMSEAMGTGLKESTIQLGKALNDPIQGISALSRVGVQLSDDQKAQIKSFMEVNDVASAQKVILGELETQFGGMAKAASKTMTGAMQQASNAMGDTAESMGSLMEPAVIKIAKGFSDAATSVGNFFRELRESDMETTIRRLEEMGVTGEALVNLKKSKLQDDLKEINDQIESMGGGGRTLEDVNAQIASLTEGAATGGTEQLAKAMTDRERISQNILILEKALASGSKERIELIAKEGEKRLIVDAIEAEGRLLTLRNQNVIKDNEAEIGEKIADRNEKQLQEAENLTILADKLKDRRDIQQEINDLGKEDTPPPIINEDSLSAFDQFVIKQAERLDVLTKEKLLINRLAEEYPKLAESLGIVTDAQKKQQDAEKETEKSRKRQRQQVAKDSMEIGKMAMKDSDAAKNAAIDKISSYAMSAAAKQMEKIISSVPFPFNIPLAAAGGLAIGAAVGGLADNLKKAQYGMNEVVDEPTLILAGEAGAEQVSITPLESPNIEGVQGEGASVVVNVSGNVLTSDFVEGELADNIREAVRRGTDFGIG